MTRQNLSPIVMKFGGSSLRNEAFIKEAAKKVAELAKNGKRVVVVVSAIGETTDELIRLIRSISANCDPKDYDDIVSMGERLSARLFYLALKSEGVKCHYFDPMHENWPIVTDNNYTNSNPIFEACKNRVQTYIIPLLEAGVVPIIPGFIGRTRNGEITTLGRGGSDTTAIILGSILQAEEVILVTNVDGIMTADPKIVPSARLIKKITVEQLIGLSDTGEKFIHSKALKYKDEELNVRVMRNDVKDLKNSGTVIVGSFPELKVELVHEKPLLSITIIGDKLISNVKAFSEFLNSIVKENSKILGISADSNSVIIYADLENEKEVIDDVHSQLSKYSEALAMAVRRNLALIRVKGVGLEEKPGIIGKISFPLYQNGINIYGMFTIASSVMLLISWDDYPKVLDLVKKSLEAS